jgi:hypothetical protein
MISLAACLALYLLLLAFASRVRRQGLPPFFTRSKRAENTVDRSASREE